MVTIEFSSGRRMLACMYRHDASPGPFKYVPDGIDIYGYHGPMFVATYGGPHSTVSWQYSRLLRQWYIARAIQAQTGEAFQWG